MCKPLCSKLLLLAIFVLILNFSHAIRKSTMNRKTVSTLNEAFDIFRIVFNEKSNDTYLRNLRQISKMNKMSAGKTSYYIKSPGKVTCNKFLSKLANCPFNEQVHQQKI
ncbi:cystatin-related protein 2-like [Apodemus sylvaticus]|uniref:cystatin-related protein 2-like n=1 Tax=Apodemus sylvaticus TaxID=10129 RepID=UPI002243EB49|nr:cystatin-related protein 2-like [Apodemus sylvaticus]